MEDGFLEIPDEEIVLGFEYLVEDVESYQEEFLGFEAAEEIVDAVVETVENRLVIGKYDCRVCEDLAEVARLNDQFRLLGTLAIVELVSVDFG